ncbi:MAG: hypothetical protein ACON39_06300 [Coraliomargaritaceae bacterium]
MSEPGSEGSQSSGHAIGTLLSPFLWLALVAGVLVHLAGFLVFQIVTHSLPEEGDAPPLLEYLSERVFSGEVELEEQAILFDSAPLFVPTRWSASSGLFTGRRVAPWVFPEYEPEIRLLEDLEPVALVVDSTDGVQAPEELLDSRYWDFFTGFASGGQPANALPTSGPVAEIQVIHSSRVMKQSARLTIEEGGRLAERPALFFLRVDTAGQRVSQPRLVESSGEDAFDQAAREWLLRSSVSASLPAGYLSVRVFPGT